MATPATQTLLDHLPSLRRWIRRKTRDPHLIDDVLQETMVQALSRMEELRDPEKLAPWLCRIAERRLIDASRRPVPAPLTARTEPHARELEPPDGAHATWSSPEGARHWRGHFAVGGPRIEALRSAVDRLPPSLRRALRLHYLEERSVADVARVLGTTPAGVKSRLYRARARIRNESTRAEGPS